MASYDVASDIFQVLLGNGNRGPGLSASYRRPLDGNR